MADSDVHPIIRDLALKALRRDASGRLRLDAEGQQILRLGLAARRADPELEAGVRELVRFAHFLDTELGARSAARGLLDALHTAAFVALHRHEGETPVKLAYEAEAQRFRRFRAEIEAVRAPAQDAPRPAGTLQAKDLLPPPRRLSP